MCNNFLRNFRDLTSVEMDPLWLALDRYSKRRFQDCIGRATSTHMACQYQALSYSYTYNYFVNFLVFTVLGGFKYIRSAFQNKLQNTKK